MADYSAVEAVLASAIPQVWDKKYPDHEFTRTIHVEQSADDNFRITEKTIHISPKVMSESLNLFKFCSRVAEACWDFDHLAERRRQRLWEHFSSRLGTDIEEIRKRWGDEGLYDLLLTHLPETYRVEVILEHEMAGIL